MTAEKVHERRCLQGCGYEAGEDRSLVVILKYSGGVYISVMITDGVRYLERMVLRFENQEG